MVANEVPFASPILDKISWADDCYRQAGKHLLGDERITGLLIQLKEAVHTSHAEMAGAGVVSRCGACDQKEGGSCCGVGVENKYNGTLLLINLLLGARIPKRRYDPSSCFFLMPTGCSLLARHVICVNFLCNKITDCIDPQKLLLLREKEGIELELVFFLQERIGKILKGAG
jgi:hypothetical protein